MRKTTVRNIGDVLLPRSELTKTRTAAEFVHWVADHGRAMSEVPEAREPGLLHRGPFKQFYEELYPFAMFLRNRYPERDDVLCQPHLGNQDFDAVVTDTSRTPPDVLKVEITVAREPDEHLRMEYFVRHGHGSVYGPVVATGRKATGGHNITVVPDMVDHSELLARTLKRIGTVAAKKAAKAARYGADHVLVIAFDDWQWFREADASALAAFVERDVLPNVRNFAHLYVLGLSGETHLPFTVPAAM